MSLKILVCDDSRTIRAIVRGLLEELDEDDVTEANDGEEALALLGKWRFDLVALDLHMPGRDGLACLEEIRRNPSTAGTPVVFITSDMDPQVVQQAESLGVLGYLEKPFSFEAIEEVVAAARQAQARG